MIDRIPYPDTHDVAQQSRSGNAWPKHKARARRRKARRRPRGAHRA